MAASFDNMMEKYGDVDLGWEEDVMRDVKSEPLTGPIKRSLPFAAETMPELKIPTQRETPRKEFPGVAAFTGISIRQPKSPVQQMYDTLDFSRSEIVPFSGNREWDQLVSKHMAPLVEDNLNRYVESAHFKNMSREEQGVALRHRTNRLRKAAQARARGENPELYRETREFRRNKRERRLRSSRKEKLRQRLERLREMEEASG